MFGWMDYLAPGMVAHAVLGLSFVGALGLVLGSLGFRGIRLGAAGVLFAGLLLGQTGLHIDQNILEFVRDFWSHSVCLHGWPPSRAKLLLFLKAPRSPAQSACFHNSSAWRLVRGGFPVSLSLFFTNRCRSFLWRYHQHAELGCRTGGAAESQRTASW